MTQAYHSALGKCLLCLECLMFRVPLPGEPPKCFFHQLSPLMKKRLPATHISPGSCLFSSFIIWPQCPQSPFFTHTCKHIRTYKHVICTHTQCIYVYARTHAYTPPAGVLFAPCWALLT